MTKKLASCSSLRAACGSRPASQTQSTAPARPVFPKQIILGAVFSVAYQTPRNEISISSQHRDPPQAIHDILIGLTDNLSDTATSIIQNRNK